MTNYWDYESSPLSPGLTYPLQQCMAYIGIDYRCYPASIPTYLHLKFSNTIVESLQYVYQMEVCRLATPIKYITCLLLHFFQILLRWNPDFYSCSEFYLVAFHVTPLENQDVHQVCELQFQFANRIWILLTVQTTKPWHVEDRSRFGNFQKLVEVCGWGRDVEKLPSGIWLAAPDWSAQNSLCR